MNILTSKHHATLWSYEINEMSPLLPEHYHVWAEQDKSSCVSKGLATRSTEMSHTVDPSGSCVQSAQGEGPFPESICLSMVMGVNQTTCDHFAIYTNIRSLSCMLETNIMSYDNYTSIFLKKAFA